MKVSSKRGFIRAVAVVTRRLRTLNVNGQQVETVGIPLHWGFEGVARKGYIANTLTPNVGDSNSQTPEYKAFGQHRESVRSDSMAMETQDIIKRSATNLITPPRARDYKAEVAKLIDVSSCVGCKACRCLFRVE